MPLNRAKNLGFLVREIYTISKLADIGDVAIKSQIRDSLLLSPPSLIKLNFNPLFSALQKSGVPKNTTIQVCLEGALTCFDLDIARVFYDESLLEVSQKIKNALKNVPRTKGWDQKEVKKILDEFLLIIGERPIHEGLPFDDANIIQYTPYDRKMNMEQRHVAIMSIKNLTPPIDDRVKKSIMSALSDPNKNIRYFAAQAAGIYRVKNSVSKLKTILHDKIEDIHTRRAAAEALGKIATNDALKALKEILTPKSERFKVLGIFKQELDLLEHGLIFKDVLTALGNAGDKSAVELISQFLDDHHLVSEAAAEALSKLPLDLDERLAEKLINAIQNDNEFAPLALGVMGHNPTKPLFLKLLQTGNIYCAKALGLLGAKEDLLELLEAASSKIRFLAAIGLVELLRIEKTDKIITALI